MNRCSTSVWAWGVSLVLGLARLATGAEPPETPVTPPEAAQAWLTLADEQKYAESWDAAAKVFHDAIARGQWVQAAELVRKPLGLMMGRKLKSQMPKDSFPGGPKGEYLVLEYDTSFATKRAAVETVIVAHETGGMWRVASYFIK